jgi:BirA family transcriptional regulator, biotin operon repressor / biotin---[acetyl-CoA-carboxylase] ligase
MGPREYHAEIGSTQERALELARQGALPGTRVRAGRQSAGRGRDGHVWESPPGGLWISIVAEAPAGPAPVLPLALGAALRQALADRYRIALALKWPNDLLAVDAGGRGRKLGGLLVDRVETPRPDGAVVVGVGINVAVPDAAVSSALIESFTSLDRLTAPAPTIDDVEETTVAAVLAAAERIRGPTGASDALRAVGPVLYGVGRRAWVDGVARGRIEGVGPDGELRLREGSDLVSIRTGDLRVEEPG